MKLLLMILIMLLSIHVEAQDSSLVKKPAKVQKIKSPRADAGRDKVITLPDNEVTLSGEAKTSNPKIKITNYHWNRLSGPDQCNIDNPDQAQTKISKLVQGDYQFVLTVIDSRQNFDSDTVSVKVRPYIYRRPIADAGSSQTTTLPKNYVTLSGRGTDPNPNGNITKYEWSQVSGQSRAEIVNPDQPITQVNNLLIEGDYIFSLKVTDHTRENFDVDTVSVKVKPRPKENHAPTADAGDEQTIDLPKNYVTLSGKGFDADGDNISYKWTQVAGQNRANIVEPLNKQTQVTNLKKDVYQFELVVTDNNRAQGRDKVIVNVFPAPPPLPPIEKLTADAGFDQFITLPDDSVTLTGSGSSPPRSIKNYRWTKIDGPPSFSFRDSAQSETKISGLDSGKYTFKLVVTDNKGATDEDVVSVYVKSEHTLHNNPPTAIVGPPIIITLPLDSVFLNGSGTDPDSGDVITHFLWSQFSGPNTSHIDTASNAKTGVNQMIKGTYKFRLRVIDNHGAFGENTITITVKSKSSPAIILIIGTGIVALLSSFYFIFWIPPLKKVMIFFMHKDEEDLVRSLLPASKITEGYAVSHASKSKIKTMKKKGLAIHVLNPANLLINTPGKTSSFHYSFKKGQPTLRAEKIELKPGENIKNLVALHALKDVSGFPSFYMITLDSPLLPAFEEKLKKIGLHIIQHVPNNSYIIYIERSDQYDALHTKEFDFVRLVTHYSAEDTGLIVREDHYIKSVDAGDNLILDLVLHREEDKEEVIKFLEHLEITIIGSYRNRIRIDVSSRSVLDYNLSANKYIQAIYEYIPVELLNDVARQLVGIGTDAPDKNVITETGMGEIIGVADTGIDSEHPDLKSRIVDKVSWGRKQTNDTSDPHGHGTHVTGSIVGDGTASGGKIKGMAPGAKVFFQSLLDSSGSLANFELRLPELFLEAYNKGARIHNNSWGSAAEARYTIDSTIVDEFIFEHPEMLIVISAGNEGICNTKSQAEKGYVGFGSIGSPATTKNGLTVGASRNKRTSGGYASTTYGKIWPEKYTDPPTADELISGDPESIAAFSSRGLCDDHRMKPDIVAPGTDILSARSSLAPLNEFHGGYSNFGDKYAYLGGTSMAAPIVSGAAALVREYYKKKRDCQIISAALIKATLINGTHKMTGQSALHDADIIPNPNQGFGRLDLANAIPNEQNMFLLEFRDSLQDGTIILERTGQTYTLKLVTQQVTWIRACMAYTDFPVRAIQNDLDLIIDYEPTRQKWSGNLGIDAEDPFHSKDEDSTNNMEIIRIDNAQPGLYTIKVIAHNLPKGKQGFALVITTGDLKGSFT